MEVFRSSEFNYISDFFNNLNQNGGLSYSRIKDLKITGGLNYYFEKNEIDQKFKIILDRFISILNDNLSGLPYSRRFLANTYSELTTIFLRYGYSFGAYLNKNIIIFPENNKLFIRFPLFFKCACEKYNIEPYASMDEVELKDKLSQYVDISCGNNSYIRADRNKPEYEEMVSAYSTCYHDKYEEYYNNNIGSIKDFSIMDDKEFIKYMSIAAEEHIYKLFCKSGEENKFWVSQYVDSYGYDILSFDNINQKEILAEVKSSFRNEYFDLTTNEYKTMIESGSFDNTEYRVYKFFYNRSSMLPEKIDCYVYDKKTNILTDINDPKYGCKIYECKEEGGMIKYRCCRQLVKDITNINYLVLKNKK